MDLSKVFTKTSRRQRNANWEKQCVRENKLTDNRVETLTLGAMKMPEPIMFPTMRQTPWRREISCFSCTPLPCAAESTSATILREEQLSASTQRR